MRIAAGMFALAVFANVVGLESLSNLAGSGTLFAAYGAVLIYAVKKAVESLAVYSLVLWPLNKLNLVSRHRASIRQGLERGIAVVAALLWVVAMLRVYGLDQIFQSFVVAVLGASLEVGALSISIGGIAVFVFTVWLSFAIARLFHTVLADDVFPRVRLARPSH